MMLQKFSFSLALTALTVAAPLSHAAVIGITAADFTGPSAGGEFTGATTVSGITLGSDDFALEQAGTTTAVAATSQTWSFVGTNPGSNIAASSGNRVDTASNNIFAANVVFSRSIKADERFFVLDFEGASSNPLQIDAFEVIARSGGADVGSTLTVASQTLPSLGQFNTPSRAGGTTAALPDIRVIGVTFSLADFGLTESANVDGFLVRDNVGAQSLDLVATGIVSIPEPASLALVGLGALCMMSRRQQG